MIDNHNVPKRTGVAAACMAGLLGLSACSEGPPKQDAPATTTSNPAPECIEGIISGVNPDGHSKEGLQYTVSEIARLSCVPLLNRYGPDSLGKIVVGDGIITVCDPKISNSESRLVTVMMIKANLLGYTIVSDAVYNQFLQRGLEPCSDPTRQA